MQGYNVPRKGGWDTHGLPVEVQVEKALKLNSKKDILKYGVEKFNKECRDSVFSYIQEWVQMTKRMAYGIDLNKPYITLENEYIESVWWSLKELYAKRLLYEGHKVVPFCPRCETPLSSHEVSQGYKDVTDTTIVVKFKIKEKNNTYFLAWSTTPWTIPSNVALALHPEYEYVQVKEEDKEYILAKERMPFYFKNPKIIKTYKGKELINLNYEPPFLYFKGKFDKPAFKTIAANFVTLTEGTGIVHMAPAFGEEDYEVCKKNGIAFVQPITEEGKFTEEVPDFQGMFVKDADPKIINYLETHSSLFKKEKYTHAYPFCWRCDTPLIYYAMVSWFIKVTAYKERLIELNQSINWYPAHIKEGRFGDWLENVKDWALSRKKFWGTPLPIWRCDCGNEIIIGSIQELRAKAKNVRKDIDLHRPFIDDVKIPCDRCKKIMNRIPDVIDCWYDSGSASFAQFHYPFENKELLKKNIPYDFIAEAIDQTRGWFYTLHVLSVILFDKPAYKNCVCAGHIVDEKGEKMSKSKGNVLNPGEMFDQLGVDSVRLYFCSTEQGDPKRFSVQLVNQKVMPLLTVLWNTYQYTKIVKNKKTTLKIEDKWIISKANSLIGEVTENLEKHNYHLCFNAFQEFIDDLSRNYIKFVRDRDDGNVGYTLNHVLSILVKLMAPFTPYLSDFIYTKIDSKESVHFAEWPIPDKKVINKKLEEDIAVLKKVIQEVSAQREKIHLGIRWPLGKATIHMENSISLKELMPLLEKQTNIKKISLQKGEFKVILDATLTSELEKEGFAREIMRRIQDLRKKNKLEKKDRIELVIVSSYDLSKFKKELQEVTGASSLSFEKPKKEYAVTSQETIKEKTFEIYFTTLK